MLTGVLRQARRRAAINAYLEAGWPIAPGAWWDPRAEQYHCRRVGCLTTGTIHAADGMAPRADASAWSSDPATVLLVTGHGIDVVELPLGSTPPETLFSRAALPGPVALWTSVRPRLLVPAGTTGTGPVPDTLPAGLPEGVLLHAAGSYVPLPPSRVRTGDVVWMRPPQALDWQLPQLGEVVDLLTRRLLGDVRPDATSDVRPAPAPPASPVRAHRAAVRTPLGTAARKA
ncbi:MAG TPA: hypothetical protein VEV65_14310 [Kineosporiaceae bacterium]|jgi:hypothetical protein|nr:hypothetical protein [Kineosporiaceae bacterium]